MSARLLRLGAVALPLALLLGGCAYDYMQRSDKIAYSYGDAVRSNMEAQTVNPSKPSSYSTKGLGKNGPVTVTPAQ